MAGGRCRSYYDAGLDLDHRQWQSPAALGQSRGARLCGAHRRFAARSSARENASSIFSIRGTASAGGCDRTPARIPWWIFAQDRRVPGTEPLDYLGALGLLRAGKDATIGEAMTCSGPLYERLWRPVLLVGAQHRAARGLRRARRRRAARDARGGRRRPAARWSPNAGSAPPSSSRRCATLHAQGVDVAVRRAAARDSFSTASASSRCAFGDETIALGADDSARARRRRPGSARTSSPASSRPTSSAASSTRISKSRRPLASRCCSA